MYLKWVPTNPSRNRQIINPHPELVASPPTLVHPFPLASIDIAVM